MKKTSLRLLSLGALLAFATQASAQSFNIDVGDQAGTTAGSPYPVPSSAYAGAANQAGTWINGGAVAGTTAPLMDITGATTAVTATHTGGAAYDANNFGLTGDDAKLMCDTLDAGTTVYTFNNLQAGSYSVFTYAWAPDFNTYISLVTGGAGTTDLPQTCGGGTWTGGAHVLGQTYTLHNFPAVVANGNIVITVTVSSGFSTINGFQIKKNGAPPSSFMAACFGDGTGTGCPCGNTGAAGNGCASSVNGAGANLAGTGTSSIANDTLSLNGSGMPNSSALYFQGTTLISSGAGSTFGDGLRCAGGAVIRLGTKTNVGGSSSYPGGSTPISIKGANTAGNTRTYQCWYRNAAAFCNPETFNLTNGGSVVWTP